MVSLSLIKSLKFIDLIKKFSRFLLVCDDLYDYISKC